MIIQYCPREYFLFLHKEASIKIAILLIKVNNNNDDDNAIKCINKLLVVYSTQHHKTMRINEENLEKHVNAILNRIKHVAKGSYPLSNININLNTYKL